MSKSSQVALIRGLKHLKTVLSPSAITMGNFDGVHLGHQALIKTLIQQAKKRALLPIVVLFEPQTSEFFLKENAPTRLMRLREKIKAIEALGIRHIVLLPFNSELANLSAETFLSNILLKKLQLRCLVAGEDFCFGKKRQGNAAMLNKIGIETITLPEQYVEGKRVSSSLIRESLSQGNLEFAKRCLGHYFKMSGYVKRGKQRGRSIGFPTANINLHRKKVPMTGVYVVRVNDLNHHQYFGVANIGTRPTVDGTRTLLEVHIFDFDQSIYEHYLDIEFIHKLREEKRFDSFDALVEQIHKDVEQAKGFLIDFG
jgi:riboflavin kinase / FMN adenylyltransferase